MKQEDIIRMAREILNAAYVPADLDEQREKAITAIEEALAQPAQEPVGDEWTPCMKLPVVVHVRKQRLGEAHVSTREGITPVKPDDLIMRGVSGEEYPIGRAIFEQTYSLDPTPPAAQPAQRQPLTDEQIQGICWHLYEHVFFPGDGQRNLLVARAIEAAHNIGAKP
jgi:hypothetical protein